MTHLGRNGAPPIAPEGPFRRVGLRPSTAYILQKPRFAVCRSVCLLHTERRDMLLTKTLRSRTTLHRAAILIAAGAFGIVSVHAEGKALGSVSPTPAPLAAPAPAP